MFFQSVKTILAYVVFALRSYAHTYLFPHPRYFGPHSLSIHSLICPFRLAESSQVILFSLIHLNSEMKTQGFVQQQQAKSGL